METHDTQPIPAAPAWRRTTVIGKTAPIEGVELKDHPGTCAGCRRPFNRHTDDELRACAAGYEPTEPTGAER
jgi:hypothetical protein